MSRPYRFKNLLLIILAVVAFSSSSLAQANAAPESSWSYPSTNWPTEYPDYCSQSNSKVDGVLVQQSPIQIPYLLPPTSTLGPIQISYESQNVEVEDNGHTIEPNFEPGSSKNKVTYAGKTYNLLQFHFHQPNEHTFTNFGGPTMEVHLVHQAALANGTTDPNGAYLVVGVMMTTGTAKQGNPTFGTILANIGKEDVGVNPAGMLPGPSSKYFKLNYFTYTGSLTTPVCTPGVTWVVLAKPITISPAQIRTFETHYTGINRGVQAPIQGLILQKSNISQK